MTSGSDWGSLITQLRKERGVSQRQLAIEAKVSRSTLRKIENGETVGFIDDIERILNYLGYELEALTVEAVDERRHREAEIAANPELRSQRAASFLASLPPKLR